MLTGSVGWLVDADERCVYVYRPDASRERLDAPSAISGEPLLPGLSIETKTFW